MAPGICLHVKLPLTELTNHFEKLPAQDRVFHIFTSNIIIANKWLISPQSLKIFILFCFVNSTRPLAGMKTWRATYCGKNPEGEVTFVVNCKTWSGLYFFMTGHPLISEGHPGSQSLGKKAYDNFHNYVCRGRNLLIA